VHASHGFAIGMLRDFLLSMLAGPNFRAAAASLPGIDTGEAGTTMSVEEAFPDLPLPVGKTREARAAKAQ